jgi:hypothetical protein
MLSVWACLCSRSKVTTHSPMKWGDGDKNLLLLIHFQLNQICRVELCPTLGVNPVRLWE